MFSPLITQTSVSDHLPNLCSIHDFHLAIDLYHNTSNVSYFLLL